LKISLSGFEKTFFIFIAFLHLLPVLNCELLPTLDGPSHLYNAQLLKSLLFNLSELPQHYYLLNDKLVPNWSGHFLLTSLNLITPAPISEKILQSAYVLGLAFSFRFLVSKISPSNMLFSYWIFPFIYSLLFLAGFYNYCIALVLFFISIACWISLLDKKAIAFSTKNICMLTLLMLLIYFSHLYVFIILLLTIFIYLISRTIADNIQNQKVNYFQSLRLPGAALLFTSVIPLYLSVQYLNSNASKDYTYIEKNTLVEWLFNIRPIITYNVEEEQLLTFPLFILLVIVLLIAIYNWYIRKKNPTKRVLNFNSIAWGCAAILMLIFYFTLPDSDGDGGFISFRNGLFFFLFFILWLSTLKFKKWQLAIMVAVILISNYRILAYNHEKTIDLKELAVECWEMSKEVNEGSVVLPIDNSGNWLAKHFSNYLGISKPMIILENYEAGKKHFPITWNEAAFPQLLLGKLDSGDSCLEWKSGKKNTEHKIDYVFIIGKNSAAINCDAVKIILSQGYRLKQKSKNCSLFELHE
jgi:hypothetical protein